KKGARALIVEEKTLDENIVFNIKSNPAPLFIIGKNESLPKGLDKEIFYEDSLKGCIKSIEKYFGLSYLE
ncbi:MAG: hypothetical protein WC936_01695, partial [Candidatus Nanoarchaeia archaeon]